MLIDAEIGLVLEFEVVDKVANTKADTDDIGLISILVAMQGKIRQH